MENTQTPQPQQNNTQKLSVYLGIVVLLIIIGALGIVVMTYIFQSDEPTQVPEEVPLEESIRPNDDLLMDQEFGPLDESSFDPNNPDIENQIQLIEQELESLDTELLEEELSDEQLGIE